MTWTEAVRNELMRYKDGNESGELTLQKFYDFSEDRLAAQYPDNNHVRAKIRQVLQQLRDDGEIVFVDNAGKYELEEVSESGTTVTGIEILEQLEAEFEDI
jgi:putative restriction endonuclease